MNTQCPECNTIFNASQEQLDAAGGKVRCGQCDHIFNAQEYLLHEETEAESQEIESTETTEADESTSNQQDLEFDELLTESEPITDEEETNFDEEDLEFDELFTEPEPVPDEEETSSDQEAKLETKNINDDNQAYTLDDEFLDEITPIHELEPESFIDIAENEAKEAQEKSEFDDLPEILRANIQEENTTKIIVANSIWSIGAIFMITILILQYAYYSRAELADNQDLRPWIMRMCETLNCSIPIKKDLAAIRLLSRDLLIHPRNKKILLIKASMVSASNDPQPYPLIEIKLSNSRNEIVAMRRFKPEEYLPDSVNIESGMPPQTPVNFKLETIRPKKEASTFQFDFY